MTTKMLLLGALIVIVGGAIFFVSPGTFGRTDEPAGQPATVRIGIFPQSPNAHYPVYVAQQKGFFEEEGITAELVEINPGLSVSALLANEIDYGPYLKEVVSAALKDAPVKVVAVYPQEPAFALVSQAGLALQDITSIGTNFPNDANTFHALEIIHTEGLAAEVTTSNALSLLASGEIDAVVLNLADPFRLEDEGYELQHIIKSDIVSGFTARTETIEQNPAQVAAVIRAREKAFEFIKANPEEAKALLRELLELDAGEQSDRVVEGIYAAIVEHPDPPLPPERSVNTLIKLAKAGTFQTYEDIEQQTVTPEDIAKAFDLSLMPAHE